MAVVALLDANVLHPMPLCDTLLRLAESGLFYPRWSNEILDELVRSLDRRWPAARRAHVRRRRRMETAFEEAVVDPLPYLAQVPPDVDPKDRHVVAAALSAGAEVIVTQNVRHFGREVVGSIDLSVQHRTSSSWSFGARTGTPCCKSCGSRRPRSGARA